jgi:hypothetical protein
VLRRNENVLAPLSQEEVLQLSDFLARLTDHNMLLLKKIIAVPPESAANCSE